MKQIEALKQLFPPDRLITDGPDLIFYGKDILDQFKPNPSAVVFPKTTQEVQALVLKAREHKFALVPSGGRTGTAGGAAALNQEVVVNFSKMNKILDVSPVDLTLSTQAGATLQAVKEAAESKKLFFPIDYAAKGSSQIGGNIATNAGGVRVVQFGSMRDWVLGMTVVTGKGDIIKLNGNLHKNRSGYDLEQIIIGSEGTLCLVTEAVLKLTTPPPNATRVLASLLNTESALSLLENLRINGFTVCLFEFFDNSSLDLVIKHRGMKFPFSSEANGYLLLECAQTDSSTEEKLFEFLSAKLGTELLEIVVANSITHSDELLNYRESIPQVINEHYSPYKNDFSVPVKCLPKFLDNLQKLLSKLLPEVDYAIFGHFGDGNIHLNLLKPSNVSSGDFIKRVERSNKEVYQLVTSFNGSISAEHGIGVLKRDYLELIRSKAEIEIFRGVKREFDPDGILNPGKIFK